MSEIKFDQRSAIEKLVSLMAMLRDKEYGCPWDLEQSIDSLIPYTLEEVYEVVDAIEKNDMHDLEEELGDLLFQVVFYAQLAEEEGLFSFDDVANGITNKLVRRHPHVFPGGKVTNFGMKPDLSADQVVVNWETIKQAEKAEKLSKKGKSDTDIEATSVLDDVPMALPALERSRKLQKRAANEGFDWQELSPVLAKLKEEIGELEDAIGKGEIESDQAELGDVLFAMVNVARHTRVDAELALRSTNQRFERRFKWIETKLHEQGKTVADVKLDELDKLWEQAKATGL